MNHTKCSAKYGTKINVYTTISFCLASAVDNEIRCFSHTHMVGAGVEDYGHIGVMPTREVEPHTVRNYGYRSKFSHKNETARPGEPWLCVAGWVCSGMPLVVAVMACFE